MIIPTRLDAWARLPERAHAHDAGADLCAAIKHAVTIYPAGDRKSIPLGLSVSLAPGTALLILPRSGLARNYGVTVLNAPGLVDAGYTGEIHAVLVNTDPDKPFVVAPGMRIAQGVVIRVEYPRFEAVPRLPATARGAGGFGSTGL